MSLFRAAIDGPRRYLRIAPLTGQGAPARGATVILETDMRVHAKSIDAGSGYLCQMEPVAHYGLRDGETVKSVKVRWTDGTETGLAEMAENKTHIIRKDG